MIFQRVLLFVDVLFHIFTSSSPRSPFSYLAKDVFLAYDNMSDSSQKRKAHEMNDESEDSSDLKL